jgi:hypothetical protein
MITLWDPATWVTGHNLEICKMHVSETDISPSAGWKAAKLSIVLIIAILSLKLLAKNR